LRAAIKAGQDAAAIGVTIQLWDASPDDTPGDGWSGPRALTVEFPQGTLILENISSGPVPLQPGGVERVPLPGSAGAYHVRAWHRGREQAAAAVADLTGSRSICCRSGLTHRQGRRHPDS
jgi:hypothetical protein